MTHRAAMSDEARRLVPRQRTAVLLALVAAVAALAVIALALLVAVPPSLANLASEDADGETAYRLELDGTAAQIVVPRAWIVTRESDSAVVVRTPDGGLTARIDLVDESADAAVAAEPDIGPVRTEVLDSGLEVTHADLARDGVIAAVTVRDRARAVRIVASVAEGESRAEYRPTLAELLERITQ